MSRSQRHAVYIKGVDACGKGVAEGVAAPVYVQQFIATAPLTVPLGPPSGPLKGSSLAGYPPTALPSPKGVEGMVAPPAGMELTDRGQFNLSGNPRFISLPPEGGIAPEPPDLEAPTLTSLDPNTAVLGSEDITLRCLGSNFTEDSIIIFAAQPEPIVFVSAEEITTIVKPSLGWGAVVVEVSVQNADGKTSDSRSFTFTDPSAGTQTTYPQGPFNLIRIEPSTDPVGANYVLGSDDAVNIKTGDQVSVEATGSSAANGTYSVASVDRNGGQTDVFINDVVIPAQIDNKGRLTVIGG